MLFILAAAGFLTILFSIIKKRNQDTLRRIKNQQPDIIDVEYEERKD